MLHYGKLITFAIIVVGLQWLCFQITTELQCYCHLIPLYTCYRLISQQLCITNTSIVFENTMILQQAKLRTKSQALHLVQSCCVMSIVKVLHSFRIHSKFTRVSEITQWLWTAHFSCAKVHDLKYPLQNTDCNLRRSAAESTSCWPTKCRASCMKNCPSQLLHKMALLWYFTNASSIQPVNTLLATYTGSKYTLLFNCLD